MASLAWLLIPLVAAIGAAVWGRWAARDRTAGDISELAGYARFREAMDRAERARTEAGAPAAAASVSDSASV